MLGSRARHYTEINMIFDGIFSNIGLGFRKSFRGFTEIDKRFATYVLMIFADRAVAAAALCVRVWLWPRACLW